MIRFFDFFISALGLFILSPLFIIVIFLIKCDSKGPIFFKQLRIGKNGVEFKMYKFRTMYVNSSNELLLTVGNEDSRITKVGKFIRKNKIDEIPQLLNVLMGTMSLVGPRPEIRKYTELYNGRQRIVLSVKPGITDYASIYFKSENEILSTVDDPENYYIKFIIPWKIRLNMIYINNRSLFQYFRVIILTIAKLFSR